MNAETNQNHDDAAAYAAGALSPPDRDAFERHLNECEQCAALVVEYLAARELLSRGLAPQASPQGAKARLLARARASRVAPDDGPMSVAPIPLASRRSSGARPAWLPAARWAVAAAAVAGLLVWNLALQFRGDDSRARDPEVELLARSIVSGLNNTDAAPGASGRLYLRNDMRGGDLVVSGLPQPEADHQYQFWFARPDKSRDSAAVFSVDENGRAIVAVELPGDIAQYSEIWITQEPRGGSPKPTPPHYLDGPLVQS